MVDLLSSAIRNLQRRRSLNVCDLTVLHVLIVMIHVFSYHQISFHFVIFRNSFFPERQNIIQFEVGKNSLGTKVPQEARVLPIQVIQIQGIIPIKAHGILIPVPV